MANVAKTEFTKEVNNQLKDLDSLLISVNTDILDLNTNLRRDTQARRQLINDWIETKLAGKDWTTISDLREVFPNIISGSLIKKAYDDEKQRIKHQLDELNFTAEAYADIVQTTTLAIESEEGQKKNWEDIQESRANIAGYKDLIESGYGTSRYSVKFLSNPIIYLRDWKLADKITDRLRFKNWDEVLENHREAENFIKTSQTRINLCMTELTKWKSTKTEYRRLKLEEDRIEITVVEKIEISLKAAIDTIPENSKDIIVGLKEIESRIKTAEAQVILLQKDRSFLSTRIEELTKIKNLAEKSSKATVPSDYLQKIRSSKPRQRKGAQGQGAIEQPALERGVFETYFYEAPAPSRTPSYTPSYSSRSSSHGKVSSSNSSPQPSQHSNSYSQPTSYESSSSYDSTYGRLS